MNAIERQVLLLIGENADSPDVFQDNAQDLAPIRDSLNEAIQEVVMLTGGYKETFNLPLVSGRGFYRLSFQNGELGWVTDAWLAGEDRRLTQKDFIWLDKWDPRWMTMTGDPDYYIQIGTDIVGFAPRPSATSDVVQLSCVVIPSAYETDTDRVKLRGAFQLAVTNYAVSEYWASRGDARSAANHFELYDNLLSGRRNQPKHRDAMHRLETQNRPPLTDHSQPPLS